MSEEQAKYILTTDGDAHWFVIPADKRGEWSEWCERVAQYWEEYYLHDDDAESAPAQPDWAVAVGGAPSRVKFIGYEIE